MKTQPVLSDLELSILGLLRERARSGYELRQMLDSSPGSVYPALRRLRKAGLLDGNDVTEGGRRALRQALSPTIDKEELRRKPDEVAFRMRFLTPAALTAFLVEYGRRCDELADELKGAEDILSKHDAAIFRARSRWAKEISRQRPGSRP